MVKLKKILLGTFFWSLLHAAQPADPIAEAFEENGGMQAEETFFLKTFEEMAQQEAEKKPFLLAVIPAGQTYHFFCLYDLFAYWSKKNWRNQKPVFEDPINRNNVDTLLVYGYNQNTSKEFPFDYKETLGRQELLKRVQTQESFDEWAMATKKKAADWIMDKLAKNFIKPTKQDLEQVYYALEVPVNNTLVNERYQSMLSKANSITRNLLVRRDRRYTNEKIHYFVTHCGFPFSEESLRTQYHKEMTHRSPLRIHLYYYSQTTHHTTIL